MSERWKERVLIRQAADAERLENAENSLLGVTARRVSAGQEKSSDRSLDRAFALRDICTFYGISTPDFHPDRLENESYVEDLLRKNGIMARVCILSPGWEKNAFGPYLCRLTNGVTTALLPGTGASMARVSGSVSSVSRLSTGLIRRCLTASRSASDRGPSTR